MSAARQKGTRHETGLLEPLRAIWPNIDRAPLRGTNDQGDFTGCPGWLLEAKHVTSPRFLEWARTCRKKAAVHNLRWAVLWKGDARTERGQPLVLLELDTFLALCANETP